MITYVLQGKKSCANSENFINMIRRKHGSSSKNTFKKLMKRSRKVRCDKDPDKLAEKSIALKQDKGQPKSIEYSTEYQLHCMDKREQIYAERGHTMQAKGNKPSQVKLSMIMKMWRQMEKELRGKDRKIRFLSSGELHDQWNEWLRLKNPTLFHQLLVLRERRLDLYGWFCLLDLDGSGEISVDELVDPLLTVGLCTSKQDVIEIIKTVDTDGSGEIGFDEFMSLICSDVEDSKASKTKSSKNGDEAANPIAELYKVMATGGLGDMNTLSFSTLLTGYRRKVILRALAPREEEYGTPQRAHDAQCVNALQRLYFDNKGRRIRRSSIGGNW